MTTPKEMSKITNLVRLIQREGVISKVRLIMLSGISISYYEKLKPFIEEMFPHLVQYDKLTRTWKSVTEQEIEQD